MLTRRTRPKQTPQARVLPDSAVVGGGMNITVPPLFAKPGTARLAYNYEYAVNGGAERVGGIEPFDGQPSPSAAAYTLLQCSATISGISLGDTVDGADSGAQGVAIYISGDLIALTRVTGAFTAEDLEVSAVVKATVSNATPAVPGTLDNTLSKLAADNYQADILQVPGSGPIRGLEILNDVVYAWRNNAGGTAMAIHRSTASGWEEVELFYELSFTGGSTEPAEGATIAQGSGTVTATIKRVVLESGAWGTSDAAGRYIITEPAGGSFSGGAFDTATMGSAPSAGDGVYHGTAITLAPSGRVRADAYNFTASLATKRLYGCTGVDREFEFDGTVYVPIVTGMSSIYATSVVCHKNYLFYAYRSSLQRSGVGRPYAWSVILGANEVGTGDEITNLISLGGNTEAAALMVTCRNALYVYYDNGTTARMDPLSRISGAQADSVQDIGGAVALDTPGVVRYPATQDFGNFAWDTVSMDIQSIAREQECACSVFVTGKFKYRLFFEDGTAISGLPRAKGGGFDWSVINYGKSIVVACHDEIAGVARTFYGDNNGWVYEADKGRSFAGDPITYALKLQPMSQRSPMVSKTYREAQLEVQAQSHCTLYTSAEFGGPDGDEAQGATEQTTTEQPGSPLIYDLSNYDQTYWGVSSVSRKAVPCEGDGTSVALTLAGESDNELPHTVYSLTFFYTPRRTER